MKAVGATVKSKLVYLAGNAEFYCSRGLPFVMGTTGGDRDKLVDDVVKSGVYSVIAPQMGKQVGLASTISSPLQSQSGVMRGRKSSWAERELIRLVESILPKTYIWLHRPLLGS